MAAVLAPLLAAPLLTRPLIALGLVAAILAVLMAWHSVAWPLALGGFPPVLFALTGSNPLPSGGVIILLAGWIALAVGFAVVRRTELTPAAVIFGLPVLASIALAAWMAARIGGSPTPDYGTQKLQLFMVGNLAYIVGGTVVGWRPRPLRLLIVVIFAVSFAGAAVLVYQFLTGSAQAVLPDRFTISADNDPIALGRASAGGLLIAIYLILTIRSQLSRVLVMATMPVLAIALLAAGSRGPVLGVMAGLVVFAALIVSVRAVRRRLLAVAAAALLSVLVVPVVVPQAAVSRSLEIFAVSGGGLSSNGRTDLWGKAISVFSEHSLFGLGTGGFSSVSPVESYPHNIFLETGAELGVIGLALIVLILADIATRLVGAWRRMPEGPDRQLVALILALFTTGTVNGLFSGALPDNRVIWLWGGVGLALSAQHLGASVRRRAAVVPGSALTPGLP